jgi:hypothetical protein
MIIKVFTQRAVLNRIIAKYVVVIIGGPHVFIARCSSATKGLVLSV